MVPFAKPADVTVDLADVRLVRALLGGVALSGEALGQVHAALAAKDASALARLTRDFPAASRQGLAALLDAYGDISVLDTVRPHLLSAQTRILHNIPSALVPYHQAAENYNTALAQAPASWLAARLGMQPVQVLRLPARMATSGVLA